MKHEYASIVIPTFNKRERLTLVLDSYNYQTIEHSRYEVLVIDDGSVDGTEDMVRRFSGNYSLQYIKQGRNGRSAARNRGIAAARWPIIIFCDDDTIASPDFLLEHLKPHAQGGRIAVHGKIFNLPYLKFFRNPVRGELVECISTLLLEPKKLRKYLLSNDYYQNLDNFARQRRVTQFEKIIYSTFQYEWKQMQWLCCTGGNFSTHKSLVQEGGMFDEKFGLLWGGEDIELGYRLNKIGVRFYYSERACNYHIDHFRNNYKNDLEASWQYFYHKHPDPILGNLPKLLLGEINDIGAYLTSTIPTTSKGRTI